MSCVVYQTNKQTGHVYAYESVSYRDPITRKPKSKRTFIGRVDPVTKQLLDPAKAARLRQKRLESSIQSNPEEPKHSDLPVGQQEEDNSAKAILQELRDLKALYAQEHKLLESMQQSQAKTEVVLTTIASVINQSYAE